MEDIANVDVLYSTLKVICNSIAYRLQKDKQLALNIGVQIRYSNFETINRSKTLINETNDEYELYRRCKEVFDDYYDDTKGVRLIGAFTNRLKKESEVNKQISIFDDFDNLEKDQKIKTIIADINKTIGKESLKKGIK
ncbi:MAG: hypothetical protein BHW12_08635 [Coprobacillus sp. 28_7]|nr:MAG: hypothetical protein BHW12_08635 [Coprobacillus sp. 28_7]